MNLVLLFLLMSVAGGIGGAGGSMLGNALGSGGSIAGGVVFGVLLVVAAGYLATQLAWVRREHRFWTIVGGLMGFASAALVTLATLSSPVGPLVSTLLVGMGATLGTLIGRSAHLRLDA